MNDKDGTITAMRNTIKDSNPMVTEWGNFEKGEVTPMVGFSKMMD